MADYYKRIPSHEHQVKIIDLPPNVPDGEMNVKVRHLSNVQQFSQEKVQTTEDNIPRESEDKDKDVKKESEDKGKDEKKKSEEKPKETEKQKSEKSS